MKQKHLLAINSKNPFTRISLQINNKIILSKIYCVAVNKNKQNTAYLTSRIMKREDPSFTE